VISLVHLIASLNSICRRWLTLAANPLTAENGYWLNKMSHYQKNHKGEVARPCSFTGA